MDSAAEATDVLKADGEEDGVEDEETVMQYTCRMCRKLLFDSTDMESHQVGAHNISMRKCKLANGTMARRQPSRVRSRHVPSAKQHAPGRGLQASSAQEVPSPR